MAVTLAVVELTNGIIVRSALPPPAVASAVSPAPAVLSAQPSLCVAPGLSTVFVALAAVGLKYESIVRSAPPSASLVEIFVQ